MIEVEGMITVAEAAKRLNRSIEQVRRNLRQGKIKGQRIGNQWFLDEASLQKPQPHETWLLSRELIREVGELRDEITRQNSGKPLDVVEMLRKSRDR